MESSLLLLTAGGEQQRSGGGEEGKGAESASGGRGVGHRKLLTFGQTVFVALQLAKAG